ncbi:MAG: hypothetical protein NTU44_03515 [Bacteroidetes bacterium]|nr:hypothetical protein [Bacteroidota bacterium]
MNSSCKTKIEDIPLKERMKTWAFWKATIAVLAGGTGGYLYYHFIGCSSGSCAITGNPYISIFFGGLVGYFLVKRPCGC